TGGHMGAGWRRRGAARAHGVADEILSADRTGAARTGRAANEHSRHGGSPQPPQPRNTQPPALPTVPAAPAGSNGHRPETKKPRVGLGRPVASAFLRGAFPSV